MFSAFPFLSLVIWVPILGGVWVLLLGEENRARNARFAALVVSVLTFLLSIPLYAGFDGGTAAMQFVEKTPWIPAFQIFYHLGVDGISMPLVLLTTFTTVLVVVAGQEIIEHRASQYMASFLILEGLMVGAFSALDAILFYVFWEALLVPMFLIIGIWGGENRVYATIKFFLYTFLGSVLMLVAFLYLYAQAESFQILDFHHVKLTLPAQIFIFLSFLAAFAVKVPMWPVHTWLPDAHVEAPTGGSVILAAIMLKLGAYGFFRFSLPIAPDASNELDWLMIALSLIAIVYIGFVALVQPDMKKLIAYSSISHMGFATLGVFIVFTLIEESGRGRADERDHGARRRARAARLPRLHLGGALPLRRGHVRPAAQPADRRLRRGCQHHAGLRLVHDAVRARELGPAGNLRLRRRVPGDPRELPGELLDRAPRRPHPHPRGRLHPLDVQAGGVRGGRERGGRGP